MIWTASKYHGAINFYTEQQILKHFPALTSLFNYRLEAAFYVFILRFLFLFFLTF